MVSVAAIVRRRYCELLGSLDALQVRDATNCDDRTLLASYCTHVRTMGTYGGVVELSLWSSMIGVCSWAIIQGGLVLQRATQSQSQAPNGRWFGSTITSLSATGAQPDLSALSLAQALVCVLCQTWCTLTRCQLRCRPRSP